MSQIHVLNFRDAKRYKTNHIINTTSRSDDWSQGLSPFYVGPVKMYRPFVCQNVENGWQYCKLYPEHADSNGDPTDAYYEWAKAGWANHRAVRYPMGKGTIPLCSIWKGEKLDYIEARKRIYMRIYARGVQRTHAWARLKELYDRGDTITLLDFDAFDHHREGMSWDEVVHSPRRKMGHAFVLAMLLEGYFSV